MIRKTFRRGGVIALSVLSTASILGGVFLSPTEARASTYSSIDLSATLQTIDGWGTSLCWWADAVGGWDMEGASGKTKREEITDLVFGKNGLDLNIVRYNVPGGDDPSHSHMIDHRGAPLLKASADAEYVWENDANQMWILQAAHAMREGDLYVEAFNNSAPYWMTASGCSSGGAKKSDENLPLENYGIFAEYYADVVAYLQNELKIPVHSIEVMNEPNSDYWGAYGSQEGCKVARGEHQSELIKAVYNEMVDRGMLGDMIFAACDETNPGMAYASFRALDDEAKAIVEKLNYHIYSKSDSDRRNMSSLVYPDGDYANQSRKLWMSEICYGVANGEGDGDNHTTMSNVFSMTDDIYKDLYLGHVNAWIIWQAVESDLSNMQYGNNYGLIHGVYQDPGNSEYGFDLDKMAINRGDYYITKQFYTMGQYSRYIKEGYRLIQSPDSNCVVAISPAQDELVLVYANGTQSPEDISYYLKGFEGVSAKKIVTDRNVNWQESDLYVSGSYLDFTADAESVTTVVIKGRAVQDAANSGTFFKNFIQRASTLRAEFRIEDTSGSTYEFYWADDQSKLPVFGGTGAQSIALTVTGADSTVTLPDQNGSVYYGVLARNTGGKTYYSRVLQADASEGSDNRFTYLTLPGRTDKMSLAGTGCSFGANYGIADQRFGEDPFTHKNWGYTTENTGEYNSNQLFESVRYSNTTELTYKYEVERNVSYSVMLAFLDPWNVSSRSMDLWINGQDVGKNVTGTNELKYLLCEGVQGVGESNSYYITVTLKRHADTSEKPALNMIAIQTEEQQAAVFGVLPVKGIQVQQGGLVSSVLPQEVELLTSKGTRTTQDVTYLDINYSSGLNSGGGSALVSGVAEGIPFEFSVATIDSTQKIFYYIDAGATDPSAAIQAEFETIKNANPTLINTDATDKFAANDSDWGRLNGTSKWADYWADEYSAMESVTEGKYVTGSGSQKQVHLQYRLINLPIGNYTVEVGANFHGWGNSNRDLTFAMGDTVIGTKSGYGDVNIWTFAYEKTTDESTPVIFDVYTQGSSAANPLVSYIIIKQGASSNEKLNTPSLPINLSRQSTQFEVGNVQTEGALLIITDEMGKLIAEHIVTAEEAQAGKATVENADLSTSSRLSAVVYKDGAMSSTTEAGISSIGLSAPRMTWSEEADVITLTPSGNNIRSIAYRDGETGSWIEIKQKKFFRAPHNGVYYVRLTTTENVEFIESVTVTHVDTIVMNVVNDLTVWTDKDIPLALDFSQSATGMQSVKIWDGTQETDITASGTQGIYTYTVKNNGVYTVTAVSEQGSEKSFEVVIGTIDKTEVQLEYTLSREDAVYYVSFSTQSLGEVVYSYSVDGGEFQRLYQPKVPLFRDGAYVFRMTNMVGKEATVEFVFSTVLKEEGAISATETAASEGISYQFTFSGGFTAMQLVRLDGAGGKIAISGGVANFTESGEYALVAEKNDGKIYITSFFINIPSQVQEQTEGGGCGSVISADAFIPAAAILVLAGSVIVTWRKRS